MRAAASVAGNTVSATEASKRADGRKTMASYRAEQTAGRRQSARNKIEQQNEKLAEREYLFRDKNRSESGAKKSPEQTKNKLVAHPTERQDQW
jgi:hypothetical protein